MRADAHQHIERKDLQKKKHSNSRPAPYAQSRAMFPVASKAHASRPGLRIVIFAAPLQMITNTPPNVLQNTQVRELVNGSQLTINDENLPGTNNANVSGDAINTSKEPSVNGNDDNGTVAKELFDCMVCSKESEEEICRRCVMENAEVEPCSELDRIVFHVVDNVTEMTFQCHRCAVSFANENDLKQHTLKHNTDIRFVQIIGVQYKFGCNMCEYKSVTESEMAKHVWKHKVKLYKCDSCEFRTPDLNSLRKHNHISEKNYLCNICKCTFVTEASLVQHLRRHVSEGQFKCDFCGYNNKTNDELKIHINNYHTPVEDVDYLCDVCGKNFVAKLNMIDHECIHEEPVECIATSQPEKRRERRPPARLKDFHCALILNRRALRNQSKVV